MKATMTPQDVRTCLAVFRQSGSALSHIAKNYREAERIFSIQRDNFGKALTQAYYLGVINKRELAILRLRIKGRKTYDEIAKQYDVTRERIRIIECAAFQKLDSIEP